MSQTYDPNSPEHGPEYGQGYASGPGWAGYASAPPPPPRRNHKRGLILTGAVALAAGATAGALIGSTHGVTASTMTAASRTPLSASQIAQRVDPALVDIVSTEGDQGAAAAGTGIVLTSNGTVLTNNHVIRGATSIKVTDVGNGRTYTAKVVGRDPKTDIAVLKIEAKDLPFITFADSDKIEVGDVVLALGNPFGIGQTVTLGIVSATGRGGMHIEDYEDFIQTDAAINPGNSGGALVDAEGRLIGVNTAILSRTGGNQGVGFAIPANLARSVMDQIIEKGKVERGFLGVKLQDLTPEFAQQFNVPENSSGALIAEVTEKSAAAEAGLKSGDVIIELNGSPVKDGRALQLMVGRLAPGDKVAVKILRDGKEKTMTVTLKEMPEEKLASANHESNEGDSDALNGVAVGDIDSAARSRFNIPDNVRGALITDVDPDSVSYEAGLRPGDVIQEIDHKRVTNAEEAVEVSKNVKTKQVLVRLWSRGGSHYVVVDEGKSR